MEWITIFFFVGLFIVVHGVDSTGLLKVLAEKMIALTGGNLSATAVIILWSSAVLSAIIDNIPFVATMIPLIKAMAPSFGGPEGLMPLWWALSLGACLGGNGTLIGASANLVVAGFAERAGPGAERRNGQSAFEPVCRLRSFGSFANRALARSSHEQRQAEGAKGLRVLEQKQVLLVSFGEADPRVQNDVLSWQAK